MTQGDRRGTEQSNPDVTAVLDALGDETTRTILQSTSQESATVEELATVCGVSESTVYRRISRLSDLGLVEPTEWPATVDGTEYRCSFDRISIELGDGEFSVEHGWADEPEQPTTLEDGVQIDAEVVPNNRGDATVELTFSVEDNLVERLTDSHSQ